MERKSFYVAVEKSLQEEFRKKCKADAVDKADIVEALLQGWIDGKILINIKKTYEIRTK